MPWRSVAMIATLLSGSPLNAIAHGRILIGIVPEGRQGLELAVTSPNL